MLIWLALISFAVAVSVAVFFFIHLVGSALRRGRSLMSDPQHKGRAQSSALMQIFGPLISQGGRMILPLMTWGHRTRIAHALTRAGVTSLEHHHFFFLQFLLGFFLIVLTVLLLLPVLGRADHAVRMIGSLIGAGLLGFLLPGCWLRSKAKTRRNDILRTLPFFLDMLALGLNAGMSLQAALQLTLKHLEPGPLKTEWTKFLFDVRSGFSRAQALRQLSLRIDVSAVRQLVAALIQGESMGLSLTRTVLEYARQLRTMRLLHAEKLAFQAPVKMLFPLAFCIFPCTFLILGFPVVAQALGLT
jgi:tight adherence protein C